MQRLKYMSTKTNHWYCNYQVPNFVAINRILAKYLTVFIYRIYTVRLNWFIAGPSLT